MLSHVSPVRAASVMSAVIMSAVIMSGIVCRPGRRLFRTVN